MIPTPDRIPLATLNGLWPRLSAVAQLVIGAVVAADLGLAADRKRPGQDVSRQYRGVSGRCHACTLSDSGELEQRSTQSSRRPEGVTRKQHARVNGYDGSWPPVKPHPLRRGGLPRDAGDVEGGDCRAFHVYRLGSTS